MLDRLISLQQAIDEIDSDLINLLAQRFKHSREIGKIKRTLAQPIYNPNRIASQNARWVDGCVQHGLNPSMAQQVISVIVAQVLVERMEILGPP